MAIKVTPTTNFGFNKPGVNDPIDANQWGYQTNLNWDLDDTLHNRWRTTDIGSSRPTDAQPGTMWIDNSGSPWVLYVYDGTNDIAIGTIDTTGGQFTPSNGGAVTSLFLTSDQLFTYGDTNIAVPELTFTMKAGKKYILELGGKLVPNTNWGPGNSVNIFVSWGSASGLSLSPVNGSILSTAVISNTITPSVILNGSSITVAAGNTISNTGITLTGVGHFIVQTGGSDQTFSTVLNWTHTAGSSSNTANLKAGAYLTYQEIM